MITRGFYIGEIVDELAGIGAQVKMRNKLGLTDLTVFAENFFRDLLNILLKAKLVNLNKDRSNEPGLDLGDEVNKLGIQVTSSGTSAKVNSTLERITPDLVKRFTKIVILVVGRKQGSYSIDDELASRCSFSEDNIWDLDNLSRLAIGLELDVLHELHRFVRADVARLKVDLEVPDQDGQYPTSGYDKWELRLKPKIGNGTAFVNFVIAENQVEFTASERQALSDALISFGGTLATLPRVTREFLVMLCERRESGRSQRFNNEWSHLLYDKVKREYRGEDLEGELRILEHAGFISVDFEAPHVYGPAEIGIRFSGNVDLSASLLEFVEKQRLGIREVIGEINLGAF